MNEIALPDTKETDAKALSAIGKANAIAIVTPDEYKQADFFCVGLRDLEKLIVADFADSKKKADALHSSICQQEKKHLEPVQQARKIVKGKMSVWQDAEEKKRREQEAKLQAEARKRAEDEAIAQAQEAQKEGNSEAAEAILATPVEVAPVVLPSSAPKAKTIIRTLWAFRVVNPKLVPDEYKMLDMVKIGGVVRATRGSVKINGVETYEKKV